MEKIQLGDLINVDSGYAFKSNLFNNDKNGIPIIRIRDVSSGEISTYYSGEYDTKYIVSDNDLLIGMDGNFTIRKWNRGEALLNQRVCRVKSINLDNLLDEYLYRILPIELKKIEDKTPFVTVKHLSVKDINQIEISLPEIKVQQKIVNLLNQAQELIDKRKEQIEALDKLVKSRFIEMFGDPVLNTKNWDVKTVIDVCDCMVPGRDKPKSFTGGTPWITIDDLNVNSVTFKSKSSLGLTDDEINEVKRKKVPKGSVLMSCVGNLGICSIAGEEMIINQQLHSFQCNEINNLFLMYYLGFRKDYMMSQASSTTVLYMNKTVCNSIPVYLPPLKLQTQFADFVKQVDKLKFEMEKSLKELEDNFNSLMQRAFKGELFSS